MPTIAEVRQQYPQYSDMSDADLAGALYKKFYSDMPRDEFDKRIGIAQSPAPRLIEPEAADHGRSERAKMSAARLAVEPIASYLPTQDRMQKEAREQISQGADQFASGQGAWEVAKGAGNVALGTLAYVGSPVSAAYRSLIGQPVEDITGIPREYTEFAAQMATPGIGISGAGRAPAPKLPAGYQTNAVSDGQRLLEAAGRLSETGAPVTVPKAVATDSVLTQRAASVARNIPGAGDPIVTAAEKSIASLGKKADEVAEGYGGASVQGSGDAAKSAITRWITGDSKKNVSKLYDAVDNLVNPDIITPVTKTREAALRIEDARNAAKLPPSKAVGQVTEAVKADGLTYGGLKKLRTSIGEMMDSGILPEGISGGELKQIYGALSDDLRTTVQRAGGERAVSAFDRANNYNKLVSARRESLAKIVGTSGDAPAEKVFDRLVGMAGGNARADIAKLAQARKAIGPGDWDEFASGVVGRLGRDADGNFSPARFLTDYGKLSDAGKSILFKSSNQANLAQHLDDIAAVSRRWKDLQKFANPSGTSQSVLGGGIGAGLMPVLYGDVVTPLTTISAVVGARVLSHALSRPATAASVAKVARAQEGLVRSPSAARLATFETASRNLINTLGDQAKGISPSDFIRQLQGPVYAPATNEQPKSEGIVDR